MKTKLWIKESDTTTEEFRKDVNGGRALLLAKQFKGSDWFMSITILRGLGLNLKFNSSFEIIERKNTIIDNKGLYSEVDTIYAKILD